MVNVSGQMYAIPLDAVSETTKIEAERLTDVKGRKAVTLRGEVLGVVELSEMLGLPRTDPLPDVLSVVVIHDNDRRLGLVVDRLLERQEIVIKPLGAYLGDLKGISGATIMQHWERQGYRVTYLGVDNKGRLDLDEYAAALTPDTALASIMFANNEVGNIYPIQRMAEMASERGVLFHTDAVQAVGKTPIDLAHLPADMEK